MTRLSNPIHFARSFRTDDVAANCRIVAKTSANSTWVRGEGVDGEEEEEEDDDDDDDDDDDVRLNEAIVVCGTSGQKRDGSEGATRGAIESGVTPSQK